MEKEFAVVQGNGYTGKIKVDGDTIVGRIVEIVERKGSTLKAKINNSDELIELTSMDVHTFNPTYLVIDNWDHTMKRNSLQEAIALASEIEEKTGLATIQIVRNGDVYYIDREMFSEVKYA